MCYFLSISFKFNQKGNEIKQNKCNAKTNKIWQKTDRNKLFYDMKLSEYQTDYKQNWMHSKYKHNNHGYHIWNNKICFTLKLTFSNW